MKAILLGAMLTLAGAATSASAAVYDWVYIFNKGFEAPDVAVAGTMEGTLQEDLDTIIVSSVTSASIGGEALTGPLYTSVVSVGETNTTPGYVTLSGASMDLCVAYGPGCNDEERGGGILFSLQPQVSLALAVADLNTDALLLGQFNPTAWTITERAPAPVPLPAAGWMLLAGVGALAIRRKRRDA